MSCHVLQKVSPPRSSKIIFIVLLLFAIKTPQKSVKTISIQKNPRAGVSISISLKTPVRKKGTKMTTIALRAAKTQRFNLMYHVRTIQQRREYRKTRLNRKRLLFVPPHLPNFHAMLCFICVPHADCFRGRR